MATYFDFIDTRGRKCFINERLLNCCNYAVDISALDKSREFKSAFKSLFRTADEWKDKKDQQSPPADAEDGAAEG